MNKKIIDLTFFAICICLGFGNIPKILQSGILGGPFSTKLAFYPIVFGFIYTFYCQIKYGNVFVYYKKFILFSFIYLGFNFICLINGFPNYLKLVSLNDGFSENLKYASVIKSFFLNNIFDFDLNRNEGISIFLFIKYAKGIIFDYIFGFFLSYIIFCWYVNNWNKALNIAKKAVLIFSLFIIPYLFVELLYLCGSITAESILTTINPFIFNLYGNGIWPTLLMKSGIRGVFNEPSYYGIYYAFAIPLLWYGYFSESKNKKYLYMICSFIIIFFMFMTNARTAVGVLLFEILLLTVISIIYYKKIVKKVMIVVLSSICLFAISSILMGNFFVYENTNDSINSIYNKIDNNLYSLTEFEKRSNSARYPMMLANIQLGIDNPIFGVGPYLRDPYIPEYILKFGENSGEIKFWIDEQKRQGILKYRFPPLGEYTTKVASIGFVGLFIFLLPFVYLVYKIFYLIWARIIIYQDDKNVIPIIFFLISYLGTMIVGIGDTFYAFGIIYILLGIGFAVIIKKVKFMNEAERMY